MDFLPKNRCNPLLLASFHPGFPCTIARNVPDTNCYMSVGVPALWVLPRWWEFTDELVACLLHIVPNSLGVLLIHRLHSCVKLAI